MGKFITNTTTLNKSCVVFRVESREESGETASHDACLCERTKAIHVLFALLLKSVFGYLFVHACIDLLFRLITGLPWATCIRLNNDAAAL